MQLSELYEAMSKRKGAMVPHMDQLRWLARDCGTALEFGVRFCHSTVALLAGMAEPGLLTSVDIEYPPETRKAVASVEKASPSGRWNRVCADSAIFDSSAGYDLLLIDSLHTKEHLAKELHAHADNIQRYIVLHDVVAFPELTQSVFSFLADRGTAGDDTWGVCEFTPRSAGLLTLQRRGR